MRTVLLTAALVLVLPCLAGAQLAVDVTYGAERNVESEGSEVDGWVSGIVEWRFTSGLGLGIGADHQFEGASPSPDQHLGWALYLSASREFPVGAVAPFVRGGLGLGRAPCQGDTCGDGAHVRGSAGLRAHLADRIGISTEIGLSRVSQPFGGVGVRLHF